MAEVLMAIVIFVQAVIGAFLWTRLLEARHAQKNSWGFAQNAMREESRLRSRLHSLEFDMAEALEESDAWQKKMVALIDDDTQRST